MMESYEIAKILFENIFTGLEMMMNLPFGSSQPGSVVLCAFGKKVLCAFAVK